MKRRLLIFFVIFFSLLGFFVYLTLHSMPWENDKPDFRHHAIAKTDFPIAGAAAERSLDVQADNNDAALATAPEKSFVLKAVLRLIPPCADCDVSISFYENEILSATTVKKSSSNGDAQWRHESLYKDRRYSIIASASGYVSTCKEFFVKESDLDIEIELKQTLWLSLRVESNAHIPVPGANVSLRSSVGGIFLSDIQTDGEGKAEIALPKPGEYSLSASHPMYADSTQETIRIVQNPNLYTITLNGRQGLIYGRALNAANRVIPNATIELYGSTKHNYLDKTFTNQEGRYVFQNLRLDDYFVHINAGKDWLVSDISYEGTEKLDALFPRVKLTPTQTSAEVNFQLDPSFFIGGVVIDSKRRPVSGAVVRGGLKGQRSPSGTPLESSALSSANGEFQYIVDKREKGREDLLLSAVHPIHGFGYREIANARSRHSSEPIYIVLNQPMGWLKATVRDFRSKEPQIEQPVQFFPYAHRDQKELSWKSITDKNGYVEIQLPEGSYLPELEGYKVLSPQSFGIAADRTMELPIFVEKDDAPKVLMHGLAVDPDQNPIHGARLSITDGTQSFGFTESTPDGTFQLEVREMDINENSQLAAHHRNYKTYIHPLSDLPIFETIVVNMIPYQGAVKAVFINNDGMQKLCAYLVNANNLGHIQEMRDIDSSVVYFKNIDESQGPFLIVAGGETSVGFSKPFDLRDNPSQFMEVEILLERYAANSNLSMRIIDAQTNEPISIAVCSIQGVTLHLFGGLSIFEKKAVSLEDGVAVFKNMPSSYCHLFVKHVYHGEIQKFFVYTESNKNWEITLSLPPKKGE
ncbi:MAG: carboxypeptidase-like regulatory domain-containing protein [Candidatus Omnitrophota bacterium]